MTDSSPRISEDRLRNTRAWAAARPDMSGSTVIIGAIDEVIELREDLVRYRSSHDVLNLSIGTQRDRIRDLEAKLELRDKQLSARLEQIEALRRGERYDDKRDLASVIAHLRYGDSDGQDHDDAADEIERLQVAERLTRANIEGVLDAIGTSAIRVREGGGPEDTLASLALSFANLERQKENLLSAVNAKQAKIDALMLEFCPGEMSVEQQVASQAPQLAEAFRLANACTYYVPRDRELHAELVAFMKGVPAEVADSEPPAASPWISIADRLPDFGQLVVLANADRQRSFDPLGCVKDVGVRQGPDPNYWATQSNSAALMMEAFTHWMAIADPGEAPTKAASRCHCGAQEWPNNCVQIEDSRGRLHTLRGCQPGAAADTKYFARTEVWPTVSATVTTEKPEGTEINAYVAELEKDPEWKAALDEARSDHGTSVEPKETDDRVGYWGKFENGVKVWIGPMSRVEMLSNHPGHRHMFSSSPPNETPVCHASPDGNHSLKQADPHSPVYCKHCCPTAADVSGGSEVRRT